VSQSVSQSVSHPVTQPVSQSVSKSVSQLVSQSVNQMSALPVDALLPEDKSELRLLGEAVLPLSCSANSANESDCK